MTLLLTVIIMMAFATVYAGLLTMLRNRADAIVSALAGGRPQVGSTAFAASRRFSRA